MAPKYPRSEQVHTQELLQEPAYISLDGRNKSRGLVEMNKAVAEFSAVQKTVGYSYYNNYSNLDGNTSSRPGLSKTDYYRFRPQEAPLGRRDFKTIFARCDEAYQKVGLIRNVIDLMGDFACQGVRVVHPNKRIEKFYKAWFAKVDGVERSERFCNNILRVGNTIVRKHIAKVTTKVERNLYRAIAKPDMEAHYQSVNAREIPFKYVFLDPSMVEIVGGALSIFSGLPRYKINIPPQLRSIIVAPKNAEEKALVSLLPQEIIDSAKKSVAILLPVDKTSVFHYKKDDWLPWAYPMIYAILDDIMMLDKLRLADTAALDGAISNIRIFKLGSLEHKIAPSRTAAARLSSILQNNVGGGTIDLVWGPDIELVESKTNIHQFLGSEKYKPHLDAIYSGIGIPPTLTGMGGTGTTNNFISLRTLVQRLVYVRGVLLKFWNEELSLVQRAMGFRLPAKIEFDIDILEDARSIRALLVQLADRNLISDELLQLRFGHDPEMENVRLSREEKERYTGNKLQKAGPFHDPQFGITLKKIALQSGTVTPSQVGLIKDTDIYDMVLNDRLPNEQTPLEINSIKKLGDTKKGVPQQGRPINSKDKEKRKTKTFTPKTKASLEVWLRNAQMTINDNVNDVFLDVVDKKNMRSLSSIETKQIEKLKFGVLFNLEPFSIVNNTTIHNALGQKIDNQLYSIYHAWTTAISNELDRPLTLDELRQVQIVLYTNIYTKDINYG